MLANKFETNFSIYFSMVDFIFQCKFHTVIICAGPA